MAVGPFILVAALSGALYALTPTAEEYVYRDLTTVPAVAAPVPLHEQVDAAQRSHPELTVAQVWPAQQPTDSTRVLFDVPADAEGNPLAVFVDPSDARVLGEEATYSSLGELPLRRWVSGLHESLNLGAPGEVYSEFAASWLWIIALGNTIWVALMGAAVAVTLEPGIPDGLMQVLTVIPSVALTQGLIGAAAG
ncbi:hypothetical protein CXF36_08180, partial [Corynebacterium bovis]